jgi:DNA modification methylase
MNYSKIITKTNIKAGTKGKKRKNQAFKIDGKKWLLYSISVWNDIKKSPTEEKLKHPAIFPSSLAKRLIEVLSHQEDIILDPFMGTGSTLVAAQELGRSSVGIDISDDFANIARVRLSETSRFDADFPPSYKIIVDSAENIDQYIADNSIGLVITSPPYWDILTQKRTADYKQIRTYGGLKRDIGEIHNYKDFLLSLQMIMSGVYNKLKSGKYCCMVVMDIRKKDKFFPLHMDICDIMTNNIGFELDDIIIWDRGKEYNNLRPLGHPYVFRVNKIHEFILIFKK